MITEVATLTIDPVNADRFESAVRSARPLFESSPDCLSFALHRTVEKPGEYRLVIGWTSVSAHMDVFRNSDEFRQWRMIAGHFFIEPATVVHLEQVI